MCQELNQWIACFETLRPSQFEDMGYGLEKSNCMLYLQTWWLCVLVRSVCISRIQILNQANVGCRPQLREITKVYDNGHASEMMVRLLVRRLRYIVCHATSAH